MMSDLVLPLKKRKYECVDKQHEIQKELFVKLECLDYQKWCQDRQSHDTQSQDRKSRDTQSHIMKQKHKTVCDRKQKSSHSSLCPMCHKGIGSNIKLDAHVHTTHKSYKHQCNMCDCMYDTFYGKNKHERSHSELNHVGDDCGAAFQFEYKLKLHEKIHTNKDLFDCEKCEKSFTAHEMLILHRKSHETTDKFVCDSCEFKGNTQYNLDQHVRGAHGPGWLAPCGMQFPWKPQHSNHIKSCEACKVSTDSHKAKIDKIKKLCK